jgi:hypothetical protein
MYNVRKIFIIFMSLTLTYLVGHRLFSYLFSNNHQLPERLVGASQPSFIAGAYDYKRMLRLIEQTREMKSAFYEQYQGYPTRKKFIDLKSARELLAELYREKTRIERYVQAMKVQSYGQVQPKKVRTFLYYQKVIEKCIKDMELVLRQA